MKEIEAKILNVDREKLVEKLLSLGAKKIMDAKLFAISFNHDSLDFKQKGETLRLRREGDITTFTHKGKSSNDGVKILEETEVIVSDFDEMKKILLTLGFKSNRNLSKQRISYKLDDVKFEFDNYLDEFDFVPEFLEIEAPSKEYIYKYALLLGFEKKDCLSYTTANVIKHYSK